MNELDFVQTHRRHLHQHPELSLEEFETTRYIQQFLDELNIPYECPLETGVVAYLEGQSNQTLAFRADIDALPIHEENDIPYKSQIDYKMHACGHDGHTTALMLFSKRCKALQEQGQLPHNVVLIFQPAEESGGGANLLIQTGALNKYNIQAIYGIHIMPFEPEGSYIVKDNEITASATEYRFFLNGTSSHVAHKEQGRSAGQGMQHILNQLSQLQHYHLSGLKQNIVHIGQFRVGEAINTVPQSGYLEGTIRTYDLNDLKTIKNKMETIALSVQQLFDIQCEVKFAEGYPPTVNAPSLKKYVIDSIKFNQQHLVEQEEPYLFGEDFSFYQQVAPSYFVFVGVKNEEKSFVSGLHTPTLNFDEKNLIDVVNYYERLLFNFEEVV